MRKEDGLFWVLVENKWVSLVFHVKQTAASLSFLIVLPTNHNFKLIEYQKCKFIGFTWEDVKKGSYTKVDESIIKNWPKVKKITKK